MKIKKLLKSDHRTYMLYLLLGQVCVKEIVQIITSIIMSYYKFWL